MRRSRSLLFSVLAVITLCGTQAFSQDAPDVAIGINPESTYHGGDFDYVDMSTGRLNLHIPLVEDHSQRGKLNFTYSVAYSSTGSWDSVIQGTPPNQHWYIKPPKYGLGGPTTLIDGVFTSVLGQSYFDNSTGFWQSEESVYEGGWGVGLAHPLGSTAGGGSESIDASGIKVAGTTITTRDGIQYYSVTPAYIQDANGNRITLGTPMTDTVGRSWSTTSNSSDVSGCPTGGPVAPSSSTIWTIPAPANVNNGSRTFKLCYSTYNVQTSFNISPNMEYNSLPTLLTGIVLPDGTAWRLDYANYSYGDLVAVYPPTGGHVSYTWRTLLSSEVVSGVALRTVASRTTFDGTNSYTWTYNWQIGLSAATYTVTDPLGNDTAYDGSNGIITQIRSYSGSATAGNPLKTISKVYQDLPDPYPCDINQCGPDPVLLLSTTTTWQNGQVSHVDESYDPGFTFTDTNPGPQCCPTYNTPYGLVASQKNYDYGGALLSQTNTIYKALSSDSNASSYLSANLLNLISSKTVLNSTGTQMAQTTYAYDEANGSPSGVRGNLTSITGWLNGGTSPKTQQVYNSNGMLVKKADPIDPNISNPTVYTYDSTGAFLSQIQYPTTGVSHIRHFTFDSNTGLMTQSTDENGTSNPTNYSWDCMLRPLSIGYPDTGLETVTYNYTPSGSGCGGTTGGTYIGATHTKKINSSKTLSQNSLYDGLGRLTHTQLTSDPEGTDYTDTTYDADGRVYSVSNPYRSTSDPTYGLTKYQYDALNRVTTVIEPDLSAISTSYSGNCATVTDEAVLQRTSCSDALQRLTEVDEPSAPTAAPSSGSGTATVPTNGSEKYNPGGANSVGPTAAGSGVDSGSGGNLAWGNPNGIATGQAAGVSATVGTGTLYQTNYLNATHLGFNLPSNTTSINGIQVQITKSGTQRSDNCGDSDFVQDNGVFLLKAGARVGTDHSTAVIWPTSAQVTTYGSSTDTWGTTWGYTDINNPAFGAAIAADISDSGVENSSCTKVITFTMSAYVYSTVNITVWYTTSAIYDSGTASVTVNGVQMSTTYGQGDTPTSVAANLASAINTNCHGACVSPVTASLPTGSTTITLTAKATGPATDYSLTPGYSSSNGFSPPSFSVSVSGSSLTGGYDAGGALTASTFYQYDALDNLIRVDQKNGDSNSADWRTRTFGYDSLSRLLCAANPELGTAPVTCPGPDPVPENQPYTTGTIGYTYDPNSNLINKTDARGVVTTYAYDALNRLTQKSYSGGVTPPAKYGYDAVAPTGCSPTLTMVNPIGRRTAMCDSAGNVSGIEAWSYDKMGRATTDQRSIVVSGVTKTITTSYGYNFDGSIASITYPTGRTITYAPSAAGRTVSAVDTTNGINYAGSATSPVLYTPGGAVRFMTNGASLVSNNYFNARLQPCRFAVNSSGTSPTSCGDSTNKGNVLDFTYNFGLGADNGNVLGITNNITSGRSLTAAYDALKRIESAYTSTWSEQYGMDLWGNLTSITAMSGKPAGEHLSQGATSQNRFSGMSYDAAGNLLNDGSTAYTYDAESRISTAGSMSYGYDGDGKRVVKATSGVPNKIYSYGLGSDPIDETDGTGSITNSNFSEYVFFNGKRIARRDGSGNVFYYFTDHLGTSREIVQAGQTLPCYDADFYPFGRESNIYTNTCPQNYKFSGKERDETSLDNFGARYYTSQYVRFMTPDWATKPTAVPYADFSDPRSLNLYSYVRNNPLSKADLDGHCFPWCVTVPVGAVSGLVIGGGGEILAATLHHQSINWTSVGASALKGAITGAAIGLAGPEAGVMTTATLGLGGNVIGGVAGRTVEGKSAKEVLSPTAVAKDAASGFIGGAIGGGKVGETIGESVAQGSGKIAEASGDQATASFYLNNAAAIGTGVAKAIDVGQSTAESYHDQNQERHQRVCTHSSSCP